MCYFPIPDQDTLDEAILDCATKNNAEHLDWYLNFGGSGTMTNGEGQTAAHLFAMKGNLSGVDQLADDDISLFEKTDNYGMTPLMYLARNGYNVHKYAAKRAQLLAQTAPEGASIAGFLAAHGMVEVVINQLLPLCPEMVHQKVIAMVMASDRLSPRDKIKASKLLADAGFVSAIM